MLYLADMNPSIILDTDIGFDPDDLFALLFLHKLAGADLKLLITANEIDGKRAQFAKQILAKLSNTHTAIAEGCSLGIDKFIVDSLLEKSNEINNKDYIGAMKQVIDESESVIYIGIGGFTNLARFIESYPKEAKKMKIFVMGGAIEYERYPDWVEYNIKIDPVSVKKVIEANVNVSLVMAQTTHNPIYEVSVGHPLYDGLLVGNNSVNEILHEHCKLWFEKRGHGTSMHDPLTVAAALGYSFVNFHTSKIAVDEKGILQLDENGYESHWSDKDSQATEFMQLLTKTLSN